MAELAPNDVGEQLRTIVEMGFDGYLELTATGIIIEWSARMEGMFGWSRSEAIGQASDMLVPLRHRAAHAGWLRELATWRRSPQFNKPFRMTALHRDGTELTVELGSAVIRRGDSYSFAAFVRSATQSAGAEATLRERDRAVFEDIEDFYFEVDLQGNYVYANEALCRHVGYQQKELVGRNFTEFGFNSADAALHGLFDKVHRSGQPIRAFEYRSGIGHDGKETFSEMSVSLKRDASGEAAGFLGISRDTTARRRHEQELGLAKEAAEAANLAKGEFLANMSHEIRTPMNGIIGMTALALDTELSPYQADCLTTVKDSAEALLTILNDILDFSKIESRKLELESIPFNLADVIARTLKPLALKARQQGLALLSEIGPDVQTDLVGDPGRLQQILTNLLGNAIKFTTHGQIRLTVREDVRIEGSTRLHFLVADTGIGIATEKQTTVFDAFSQADSSTTRRFGGTGLGLAISTTLVQMMGGRIWVDSQPGAGSTFQFTASFDTRTVSRVVTGEPLRGRALIVDDQTANRRLFVEQLTGWGLTATAVDGGRAALEALAAAAGRGEPFEIVLLDANMPDLDGFGVAEEIARGPERASAIVMMLPASAAPGDVARCRELGVAASVMKPIQGLELRETIARVLPQAAVVEPPAEAPLARPKAQASRRLVVLLVEDNLVNQRVAQGILTARGHTVTVAHNGLQAVNAFERTPFDLVLMDVQMPEMDGLEATAAIRARERATGGHVRIVAMTARAMHGDRERCLAAGMDGYLSKPINREMLTATVEQEAPESERAHRPAAPNPGTSVDRAELMERLDGDHELLADVIAIFLDDCPRRLTAIKAAVNQGNAARIEAAAHALKGAAGNLSAAGLFDAARNLERIGAEGRLGAAEPAWRRLATEAAHVMDALHRFEGGA
jgi:PAS domain S-box-containing protein